MSFGQTASPIDTVMILYDRVYNPLSPGTGAIVGNDDTAAASHTAITGTSVEACGPSTGYCPQVTYNVEVGRTYTLWVSTYSPSSQLTLPVTFYASGPVVFNRYTGRSPIDRNLAEYLSSNLYNGTTGTVDPVFVGGTLKIDTAAGLITNNFEVSDISGNTIDANGFTTVFSGVLSDKVAGSPGTMQILSNSTSSIIFTGNNTYTGQTYIVSGSTLQIGNGGTSGGIASSSIYNDGTLIFNRSDDLAYAGRIYGDKIMALVKQGAGVLTLSGSNSFQNTVDVQAGVLEFTQVGVFDVLSNYTTQAGATTRIGSQSSTLNIGGVFEQKAGSTLSVQIGAPPDITADSAILSGVLDIRGFTLGSTPNLASVVTSSSYNLIRTTNGITGDFSSVGGVGSTSLDYLIASGFVANGGKDYNLGFQLAWTDGGQAKGTGNFTMDTGTGFTVDIVLADQTVPVGGFVSGWDGTSLTKSGGGGLALAAVNTYTGLTTVTGGYLRTTVANAIASGSGLTVQGTGNFDLDGTAQQVKALNGDGSVSLRGGVLTVDTATGTTSTFSGIIDDGQRSGAAIAIAGGSLVKNGDGTLVLAGANEYLGSTSVNAGILQIGDGGTSGSLASAGITNNATLIFNRSDDSSYTGTVLGTGTMIKQGAGVMTLSASGSSQTLVDVQAGTLEFAQLGPFTVTSDFTTQSGATTRIGSQNSTLNIGGVFEQKAGSTLSVQIGAPPDITADSAILDGTLDVRGFSLGSTPNLASVVIASSYNLIRTTNGITGDFSSVGGVGSSSLDYLIASGFLANGDKDYNLGFAMAWTDGGQANGTGNFTMDAGTGFAVDIVLADQPDPGGGFASGWDGKSLTKLGAGTLDLAAQNSYTGLTTVSEGYLTTSVANAIAASSGLVVEGAGNFSLEGTAQTVKTLDGDGSVSLRGGALTVDTAATSTFSGIIDDGQRSGAATVTTGGSLTKAGAGTLVLSGNNEYTGTTTIQAGTLQIGDGGTSGSLASTSLVNNATLAFNRSDNTSYAGALSGTGALLKQGSGVLTLSSAVSSQNSVDVQAGTLEFTQAGTFTVAGSYTTRAGAVTSLADTGSYLAIGGALTQEAGSKLQVVIGAGGDITAGTANLSGDLEIIGLSIPTPVRASDLASTRYTLITTTGGITGNFTSVTGTASGTPDYLVSGGTLANGNLDYDIGFLLSWTDGGQAKATGNFTIGTGENFDVDVALADQTVPVGGFTSGWDGRSLLKKGEGMLTLSVANSYTGTTDVSGGRLSLTANNALGLTSNLSLGSDTIVDLFGTSQAVGALNTIAGSQLLFNGGTLTIVDAQRAVGDSLGGGVDANTMFGTGAFILDPSIMYINGAQPAYTGLFTVTGGSQLVVNAANVFDAAQGVVLDTAADILTFGNESAFNSSWTAIANGVAAMTLSGIGQVQVNDGSIVELAGNNSGFAGSFSIDAASALSATSTANIGTATIALAGSFTAIANTDWAFSNTNVVTGTGTFVKTGAALLSVDTALSAFTGLTSIAQGTLTVGGPGLSGSSIGGSVNIAANATLTGNGTVAGAVNNLGTIAALNALPVYAGEAASNLTIGTLTNGGIIRLAGSQIGNTLTVKGGLIGQNGSLIINTALGADGSSTDRLVLDGGDTSGSTSLVVFNLGGSGAQTGTGIEVVQAINGATTTATAFSLSPQSTGYRQGIGTLAIGAYDYSLLRGGNGGTADSWYLTSLSNLIPPPPGNDGGGDPEPAPLPPSYSGLRPEAGLYQANADIARSMFMMTLRDRDSQVRPYADRSGLMGYSGWARMSGSWQTGRIGGGALSTSASQYTVQLGLDLFRAEGNYGTIYAGLMGGWGHARTAARSRVNGLRATGSVDGWSVGAYATWYQRDRGEDGGYIDTWMQYSGFSNNVSGNGLASESYNSRVFTASIEAGYGFRLIDTPTSRLVLEPQVQLAYVNYQASRHVETSGTQVRFSNGGSFIGRVGARLHGTFKLENGVVVRPYVEANYWYNQRGPRLMMNNDLVPSGAPRSFAEVKLGVGADMTKNLQVWAQVSGQFGGRKYRSVGGQAGLRYTW